MKTLPTHKQLVEAAEPLQRLLDEYLSPLDVVVVRSSRIDVYKVEMGGPLNYTEEC